MTYCIDKIKIHYIPDVRYVKRGAMKQIKIPSFIHDVLGEKQTITEIIFVIFFGFGFTTLITHLYINTSMDLPIWRVIIGFLLILDISAGCIANLTRGTNDFYAERSKNRNIFIAIHIHLLVIGFLLSIPILPVSIIWAYTIISAFLINGIKKSPFQKIIALILLLIGIIGILLTSSVFPLWFQIVSILFLTKVMFSFAVDHYQS